MEDEEHNEEAGFPASERTANCWACLCVCAWVCERVFDSDDVDVELDVASGPYPCPFPRGPVLPMPKCHCSPATPAKDLTLKSLTLP